MLPIHSNSQSVQSNSHFEADVQHNGPAELQFASDELRNDRDIVPAAVLHNGAALDFALNTIQDNRAVMLPIHSNSQSVQSNSHFEADVQHNGPAELQFASDELRNDRDIVLAAVLHNGAALDFALNTIQDNHAVGG